jgi:hypothetical protein
MPGADSDCQQGNEQGSDIGQHVRGIAQKRQAVGKYTPRNFSRKDDRAQEDSAPQFVLGCTNVIAVG